MKPAPWESRQGRSIVVAEHSGSTATKRKGTRIEEPLKLPQETHSEPQVESLIITDEKYSLRIYEFGKRHPSLRILAVITENLMHGLVWLVLVTGLFLWQAESGSRRNVLANLILGLLIDISLCAILKLLVKRSRPHYNQGHILASVTAVDDYSFPSGHSSRGGFLWMFFCGFDPFGVPLPLKLLLFVAPVMLALSRVVLGRHFLSDVVVGVFAGCFFYIMTLAFWLSEPVVDSIWFQLTAAIPLVRAAGGR